MMQDPGAGDDVTRALETPDREDLTTMEVDGGSDPEADPAGGADPPGGLDAIDALGIHGPPRAGQLFLNRYLVERQIGEGGMGTVWLVRHLELDAQRAIKLIISGIAFDPMMRSRFRREARAMARLTHPNAVTVHDARIGHEVAFIEMEYIRGQSLNKLLSPGRPMPLDWIARVLEQLCDVLHEAHANKIVHRDLKPSNLMLVADRMPGKEQLKVLDFGIAKILEAETESLDVETGTGCFLGSAPWSSPEQVSGSEVDGRSDLYSVGIILYEMLTGSRPFQGPLVRQVYDHLHTAPPRFAAINPEVSVPAAVEQVVLRCLAKRPEDRPRTARDLAAEFLRAVGDENGRASSTELPPTTLGSQDDHGRTQAVFGDTQPEAHVRRQFRESALEQTEPQTTAPERQPGGESTDGQAATLDDDGRWDEQHGTALAPDRAETEPRVRGRRLATPLSLAVLAAVFAIGVLVFLAVRGPAGRVPEGYRAEGRSDGDPWPTSLVRVSDGTRFLRIPGESFEMGNHFDKFESTADEDWPAHSVRLSDYYIQETEVTNSEMDAYFRANDIDKSRRPPRFQAAWDQIEQKAGQNPGPFPAVGLSHDVAEKYAESVGGRLPTEAQWEFAARSRGKPYRYVWGTDEKPGHRNTNIESLGDDINLSTKHARAYPKDRTEQGVYDLTGNEREWCLDRWSRYQASEVPPRDPEGPDRSNAGPLDFVIRGGSFSTFAEKFRTTRPRRADRDDPGDTTAQQLNQDGTADDLGFRVVIEWPRDR